MFPFKDNNFSKVTSDNLFPVGLLINTADEKIHLTGAEEHNLAFNRIKSFFTIGYYIKCICFIYYWIPPIPSIPVKPL